MPLWVISDRWLREYSRERTSACDWDHVRPNTSAGLAASPRERRSAVFILTTMDVPSTFRYRPFAIPEKVARRSRFGPSIDVAERAMMKPRVFVGAVLVATLAGWYGWLAFSMRGSNPRLRPLIAATKDRGNRPFDARVSGGFPYRPLAPVTRGASSDVPDTSHWKELAAVAQLQEAVLKDPSVQSLEAFGVSQVVVRHPSAAVETLEAALFRETQQSDPAAAIAKSADAVLLSDLSAAYFLRSQTALHARDLMAAGECAARARRLDPHNGEAAWNRAVIFEAIGVTDVARAAWSDFLVVDSTSEWAVEGRQRLRALAAPTLTQRWETERQQLLDAAAAGRGETVTVLVQRYPEQSRTLVEEDLLGQWADASSSGDKEGAGQALERARVIAEAVGKVSHDFLARDATAVVARSTPAAFPFLIRGHRDYRAARLLYKSGQHPQAEPMLASAASDLEHAGSPLAFRAVAYDITSKYYLGRQSEALEQGRAELQRLGSVAGSYPTVAGMLHWTCGLAATDQGSADEALGHHRAALEAFQRTEETSNLAGLVQVLCVDYRMVGDLDHGWLYQLQSFRIAARYASFERAYVVVAVGASKAASDGYRTLADDLQQGLLAAAHAARQPIFICSALIRRAETLTAAGEIPEARSAIADAMSEWFSVPESAMKSRLRADLEMVRASLSSTLASRERIAALNTSMEYVSNTKSRTRVARVLLLRARAYLDAGNDKAAESDLLAGIAEVETQREKATSEESRQTFLNTAVDLYDEAMRMRLRHGEEGAAFDVLETRRARWLLDRFAGDECPDGTPVETYESLRRKIPSGTAIISYSISQRVDAWVATTAVLKHFTFPRSRDQVARDIAEWREAITSRAAAPLQDRLSMSLYDELIGPMQQELSAVQSIVVVPDQALANVAFSALLDKRSGRFLIENYAVIVAPSANLYIRCLARSRMLPPNNSVLIVANPALGDDDSLAPLAGADSEGSEIAGILPNASLLRGSEATVTNFLGLARRAGLIHFAGHAQLNPLRPELSSLVFAPDHEGGRSRLYARDIYREHLAATSLVVLAACDSANGRIDSDSSLSLATAFLAAGAPAAIASLWPVDDATSAQFFGRFYHNIRRGMSAAQALREAQISSLRSDAANRAMWAAYQIIGGTV
jgi:CHAT domain-containing protein